MEPPESKAFLFQRFFRMRCLTGRRNILMNTRTLIWFCAGALSTLAPAQVTPPPASAQAAPRTLTLKDALERAQANSTQFLSAISDANAAREDILQARA